MVKYLSETDRELVLGFLEGNVEAFGEWLDQEHDIEPTEADLIVSDLKNELREEAS